MNTTVKYPELSEYENNLINSMSLGLGYRFRLSPEDREDARQEYVVGLLECKPHHDETGGENYETYISKCLWRRTPQIIRKIRPDIFFGADDKKAASILLSSALGESTESSALFRALSGIIFELLTPDQQDLLNLLIAGITLNEIADMWGLPYKTVHSRVQKLRQIFTDNGLDAPAKTKRKGEEQ